MVKRFCVFGPINSGTNLITRILSQKYQHFEITYKHSIDNHEIDPNMIYIIMYKNLYNWIASVKKEKYDIKFYNGLYNKINYKQRNFDNIVCLYNEYYNNYKQLLENHPKNIIAIDYYKLIDGIKGFEYLNKQLKKINESINNLNQFISVLIKPSKTHGKSVNNFKEAFKKREINNMFFKKEVTHYLNKYLDQKLYDFFESNP
jgi:hypothetical protein